MKKIVFIMVFLSLPLRVVAGDAPVWVEASGEATQGEHDTLKEVKDRARRDAQSRAVEKAVGTFIKSHTRKTSFPSDSRWGCSRATTRVPRV